MTEKFRYVGPAQFPNVPAEEITDEQFERMPADQRRIILHSGAYEPVAEQSGKKDANKGKSEDADKAAETKNGGE